MPSFFILAAAHFLLVVRLKNHTTQDLWCQPLYKVWRLAWFVIFLAKFIP